MLKNTSTVLRLCLYGICLEVLNMANYIERLEFIFKDVEDITDPGNMDKVLMIVEELRMEDDSYMEVTITSVLYFCLSGSEI